MRIGLAGSGWNGGMSVCSCLSLNRGSQGLVVLVLVLVGVHDVSKTDQFQGLAICDAGTDRRRGRGE